LLSPSRPVLGPSRPVLGPSRPVLGPSWPVAESIAATFLTLPKYIFRPSTINSSSFDSVFVSNYLCEEVLSQTKIIKSRCRSRLTDERLNTPFACASASMNPLFR
jgi:hypothetical protein